MNSRERRGCRIPGCLVTLPLPGRAKALDGFWCRGARPRRALLIYVHGMHSNFYRSAFKKAVMTEGLKSGMDVLSFNNRGSDGQTATERFSDCLADLDAAMAFARAHGYRRVILAGHSTGCQKITYYQALRMHPAVAAVVLLAIGDDRAIFRRGLGRRFDDRIRAARQFVARGRGDARMPEDCQGFTARRFLSCADDRQVEARLFDFTGRLVHFGRIRCPVLSVFAGADEYAVLPARAMVDALARRSRSRFLCQTVIPGADHGYHGCEDAAARLVLAWCRSIVSGPSATRARQTPRVGRSRPGA